MSEKNCTPLVLIQKRSIFFPVRLKQTLNQPFGTIIIPEMYFSNFSKNVSDLFFLHEYGHARLNFIVKLFIFVSLVPLVILSLFSILILLTLPLFLLINWLSWIDGLGSLLFCFTTILITITISWASEIDAELFAVKNMGCSNYYLARTELKLVKKPNQDFITKILYRLLYPPKILLRFFLKRSI